MFEAKDSYQDNAEVAFQNTSEAFWNGTSMTEMLHLSSTEKGKPAEFPFSGDAIIAMRYHNS